MNYIQIDELISKEELKEYDEESSKLSHILKEYTNEANNIIYFNNDSKLAIYTVFCGLENPIPYFKVYKYIDINEDFLDKPENYEMCRISMTIPRYLELEYEDLTLTSEEINEITNFFKNKFENGKTGWELLIDKTRETEYFVIGKKMTPENLTMPNYYWLNKNKE